MGETMSRRSFLRVASTGLVAAGLASGAMLSSCSKEKEAPTGKASAIAQGKGGDVTVTVTVENGTITAVEAVGDNEYPNIGTVALEEVPQHILSAQSFDVDGTAGATITSDAIKDAGEAAYNEIMGNKASKKNKDK